jgi:hypothetical protein
MNYGPKQHAPEYTHHHSASEDQWFSHSAAELGDTELHGRLSPLSALLGILAVMAVLFITIGALAWYFDQVAADTKAAKRETDIGLDYIQTVAHQNALLGNPSWVDAKAGIVRMPIDWAMEDTVRWYQEQQKN